MENKTASNYNDLPLKAPKLKGILLILFLVLLDQGTKYLAIRYLKGTSGISLIDSVYYRPLLYTAAIVFAGAMGNFIDRVFRGYVVDFIYFSLIDFPTFNVADIYVTCGITVMVFLMFFRYKEENDFDFLKPGNRSAR